jgi:hypothetical protein
MGYAETRTRLKAAIGAPSKRKDLANIIRGGLARDNIPDLISVEQAEQIVLAKFDELVRQAQDGDTGAMRRKARDEIDGLIDLFEQPLGMTEQR